MTQGEDAKLPPTQELEEKMAVFTCVGCGAIHWIQDHGYAINDSWYRHGIIRGVLICHVNVRDNPNDLRDSASRHRCDAKTVFEITDDSVSFLPGRVSYGTLRTSIEPISTFYSQAEQCFYAGIPDGAAALCRASVETALNRRGIDPDDSLYNKIEKAKALSTNPLTDVEVMLAHGSRIVTRDSIHQGVVVNLTDVPPMLSATIQIVNKLYP